MQNLLLVLCSLIIVSCGGGGGGGGSAPTPTTPAPTVNLSADPTSVLLESTSTLTWSSTNTTSCSASWTTQTGNSGSEAVTISSAGNNSFSITCSGAGGSGSASVTVEGYRNTDGVVVDGYISGAEVCIDEDESWTCDSNESSTTSDNDGKFTIKYANGNLVSIGGTDLDSQTLLDNLLITHKLTGHSDFKAVTPVTSVAAFMTDASLVNAALGIDSSIDVSTFDPVASKGDGGINDYLYEKGNQLTVLAYALQNITNNLNTTTETTQDYFKAITEEIEKEYTETTTKVDIETEAFITKAFDNIVAAKTLTITDEAKANTTKALSGVMPVIEVKSSSDLTTAVIRFAVSTLQTDIQAIANGTASAETVASYTSDVLTYIATDQNIEADEIAPDISAMADSATTSEDTSVTINVVVNDSYLTSAPISVSAGNGSNGTTTLAESSPEQIVYTPNADYNGTDTFSYTITQGDKTSSAEVTVTIEAVNDAPTIDTASTIQASENQTAVTTISVSDVDEDDLTLTLSGTDGDSFDLSTDNVLTFKEAPDFETKSSYSITLSLTDGTETVTKDISVSVTNVNDIAPEFTSEATFSAAENQMAIGSVVATDAEGDEITFAVSGSELAITSAGVLTFASAPDYETKTSYTETVTATDGVNETTQNITVTVTNVNDIAPVISSAATFSAAENQTAIGSVVATDAEGDSLTYAVSGTELAISSTGVLTFVAAPDYETKATYTATATVNDGIFNISQVITVNVTNVNDNSPVFTSNTTFSAAENQTAIGTVKASDADGDAILYSISGSDITINSSSGVIAFDSVPDYETKAVYSATVTVSDGINSLSQNIEILISNACEFGFIFYENSTLESRGEDWRSNYRYRDDMSSHSRHVRKFSANSPGDTACPQPEIFDFTIEGPDADFFELSSLEGNDFDRYYIYSTRDFDYENPLDADANNIYEYHLVGEYGGEIVKEVLTLEIKNENEYGNIESISFDQSNKNIQIAFTTNHDLPSNTAYIGFGVRGPSAPRRFWSGKIPYDPSQSNYNIEFSYGDQLGTDNISSELWGGYYQINLITFYDQNDDEIKSIFASRISGNVTTYVTVESGKNFPKVKSISGELTVEKDPELTRFTGVMEFENYGWTDSSSSRAAGTGFYPSLMLMAGSAPKGLNDYSGSWTFENESNSITGDGTFTSNINSTDLDFYTRSGKHEYRLRIRQRGYNGSYYYIYLYPQELLKFGYVDSYTTFVNNKASSEDFTGPALTYYSNLEVESCTFDNIKVYADIAMDVDYSLSTTSNPRADLTLGTSDDLYYMYSRGSQYNNGQTLRDEIETEYTGKTREDFEVELYAVAAYDKALNYNRLEKNSNYHKAPEVRKVNLLDHCDERIITNNAPVITSDAIFIAAENQTSIGSVVATDADDDSLTYAVSETELAISSTGVLTFVTPPDYETKSSYTATVTVDDGIFNISQAITVNVTDVNEAPVFTSSATFSGDENQTAISKVVASDPDEDTIIYSISGSDILIDSSTGVIVFASAPDYETKTSYTATVTASDGTNSTTQAINVNVTDVLENSSPIITNLKPQIELQEEDKRFLYTVEATDVDGDAIYFQLTGTDANKFTLSSSGVLAFKEIPDYENPTDADTDNIYVINVSVTDTAPSSTLMLSGKSDLQMQTNTSENTEVRVTNFDEDIIELTMTSTDGDDLTGPKIRLQLVVDSYTNPNSISILYQGPNAGQYWTGAGNPTIDNFKMTYDHTFTAPDTSPSGQWRIRTIRMQTDQGEIKHKQDFLNDKGFTTTTDVYNPNSDTNKPQLESISEPVVQGNDSNPNTNIIISFEITASDQENAYNRGHSRWESPATEGGWAYKGGWGSTDLSQNPPKTTFTAYLDPKTVSGIYKFEDIRLYDKAGNRKMYYCYDTDYDGDYKLRDKDTGAIVEGAVCSVNIDNPIEDNTKPQLTKFVLTNSTNAEGRKIVSHEYEIDNKTSWTDQETSLRRVYLRMYGPIGYDIYDGNLSFKGDTLLPLDAPAGTYQVGYFFVTDNALNDNKYYKNEMDELGFTTSVTFD